MKNKKKLIFFLSIFGFAVAFSYYYFSYTLKKVKNQSKTLLILQDLKFYNQEIEFIFDSKLNYINYDKIVDKLSIFESKLSILLNDKNLGLKLLNDNNINLELNYLNQNYQNRKSNIEKYKSISAIVNNSIRYIFDLHLNLLEISYKNSNEKLNEIVKFTTQIISIFTFANFDKKIEIEKLKDIISNINNYSNKDTQEHEIIEFLKVHSNLIIENIAKLQTINKNDKELKIQDNIDNLHQLLIKYFAKVTMFQDMINMILFILVLFLFGIVIAVFINEEKLKKELNNLNISLEERVKDEIKKQKTKDEIIFQQAKITAMGEMARNIAHQWRQPLNAVALIVQDIYEAYEDGELDLNYIKTAENNAMKQINFMSKTIDNFRDLFQPSKGLIEFNLKDTIEDSIKIIDSSLLHYNIKINKNLIDNISITGYQDEFSQVILNILNNAKDKLIEQEILNPTIEVNSFIKNNKIVIQIKDNGGGIKKEILSRIFEPYFTTKDQGKGIGMGLYMSKIIVEKNMSGEIKVFNDNSGAIFEIILPISKA